MLNWSDVRFYERIIYLIKIKLIKIIIKIKQIKINKKINSKKTIKLVSLLKLRLILIGYP